MNSNLLKSLVLCLGVAVPAYLLARNLVITTTGSLEYLNSGN